MKRLRTRLPLLPDRVTTDGWWLVVPDPHVRPAVFAEPPPRRAALRLVSCAA